MSADIATTEEAAVESFEDDDLEDAQIAASRYEDWKAGRSRTYTLEEVEQLLGPDPPA